MKTRVRQIDKDKWIVEEYVGYMWRQAHFVPFKTKDEADSFAYFHSKSDVVYSQFEDGEQINENKNSD